MSGISQRISKQNIIHPTEISLTAIARCLGS